MLTPPWFAQHYKRRAVARRGAKFAN